MLAGAGGPQPGAVELLARLKVRRVLAWVLAELCFQEE